MSSPRTTLRSVLRLRPMIEGAGKPQIFSVPEPRWKFEVSPSPTASMEETVRRATPQTLLRLRRAWNFSTYFFHISLKFLHIRTYSFIFPTYFSVFPTYSFHISSYLAYIFHIPHVFLHISYITFHIWDSEKFWAFQRREGGSERYTGRIPGRTPTT